MTMAAPQIRRRHGVRRSIQNPARKVVQGKPPGTRRTDGSLEQQAELAAAESVQRMTNVSRRLTETAPSRYDAPSSVGRELASELRLDLEQTFGADLAAVRIHDDAAAHTAAGHEEARAFTAGRHIYFAQGQYAPASAEGRRLLSHEIAHVLQQTGRRFSTMLIRATEREGSGDLQRSPARDATFKAFARRYSLELACVHPLPVEPVGDESPGDPESGDAAGERRNG
jgi:hypothetical protein